MQATEVVPREPGPSQIRVAVAFAGVNFLDIHQLSGRYPRPLPFVPGNEGSGIVRDVGADVVGFVSGDRVAFAMHAGGSYADEVLVESERVAHVPPTVSLKAAAAITLQGVTAICLVEDEGRVEPGDVVLVHSASGGAGAAITQLAREAGARVLGLVSTPEKVGLAKAAGAHVVALYPMSGASYAEWVRSETDGRGARVVFNAVGGDTLGPDLDALARRGHLVVYGQTAGPFPAFSPGRLASSSLTITYSRVSSYIADVGAFAAKAERLFELVSVAAVAAPNLTVLPWRRAADAHVALASRTSLGKMILGFRGEAGRADSALRGHKTGD